MALALLVLSFATPVALGESWRHYSDPQLGLAIDVPVDGFEAAPDSGSAAALRLVDTAADALIEVFGGTNRDGLSLRGFADLVAGADRIAEVTYRTGGRTWFVLSGYYRRDGHEERELIFYSKFMFSPDLRRFSGFEINYPAAQKRRFDPVVARLEASMRSPP
jgi:hypothetical protein